MSDLPSGWMRTSVGDIAEVRGGIQKQAKRRPVNDKYPFLRVANVGKGMLNLEEVHEIELFDGELERFAIQAGDLLVVEGNGSPGEIGRAAMWHGEILNCVHQNHLICVRPTSVLLPKFLELLWSSPEIAKQLRDVASSTSGLHTLSTSKIKAVKICLPPYEEQRRIVAALEGHLSRLDAAVVSALAAVRKAVALRRRTLGNLVAPDSSGSWKKCRLEDVTTTVRNGMFVSRPGHEPNGVPILRISAVRSLALDLSDLRYSAKSLEVVQREGYLLQGGDLLFTRYNGNPEYVGACAVVPENVGPLTYPDKLIRVSPDTSIVDSAYLAMACSAGGSRQAIRSAVKTTAGQAGISGGEIKRILLYLPDLDEQRRRAAEFQEHDEAVRHVEENVKSVARRGDYLRRSLLTEAFAGRLVPQDPAEEPASVLLERIRAEQAAQPRARRRPKTATHAPQEETLL